MTANDPGSGADPGGGSEDATRTDWSIGAPQGLPPAQSLPPSTPAAEAPSSTPPPGPPTPPGAPPASPSSIPPSPGYAAASGYAPGPAYGASAHAPGYAPGMAWEPPAEVLGGPGVGGLEYAGALPRLVAWIIDGLILGVIGVVLFGIAAIIFAGSIDWSQYTSPGYARVGVYSSGAGFAAFLVVSIVGLLIDVAYFVFLWTGSARATLGMRLLHLQVANAADGSTLSRGQAVRRWIAIGQWLGLLSYVPFIGLASSAISFVWDLVILVSTAASPTKQGVHDRFVGSVVVQPRGGQSNGLIIGCLLIIAILLVLPIIAIAALIFLGSQVSTILVDVGNSV